MENVRECKDDKIYPIDMNVTCDVRPTTVAYKVV